MPPVWRVTMTWKNTTDLAFGQNVIYMLDSVGNKTAAEVGGLIDTQLWATSAVGGLVNLTANNTILNAITLQRVDTVPPQATQPFTPAQTGGIIVSNNYHHVVGMIFQLLDGNAGKRHRGRMYHYGSPSVNLGLSRSGPGASTIPLFDTFKSRMIARFGPSGSTGLRWVLWHRDLAGDARWSQVVDMRLSTVLGVQRRRNPNVGL